MNIVLIGTGRMGRIVREQAEAHGHKIILTVDRGSAGALAGKPAADAVIDFSGPGALPQVLDYLRQTGTAYVCGTTGYSDDETSLIREIAKFSPVLYSGNFSLGVAVVKRMLETYSSFLTEAGFDCEIVETHHKSKKDAPSGTARLLRAAISSDENVGIHSLRGGTVCGVHQVNFFGQDETVTLTHEATSRAIFAKGALTAACSLAHRKAGWYSFEEIIFGGNDNECSGTDQLHKQLR
ncbi:MAG: 4-hydroxy-tetrahydrodipicolinate reductase [Clostridiales bacterium]|nr:4-hydroxy-tetrahydrodipicolinate reductase [Clostridiales bacterium]